MLSDDFNGLQHLVPINFINEHDFFTGECLEDTQGDRILESFKDLADAPTAENCVDYCKNFKYAGFAASNNYCFCGNELKRTKLLPDSDPCDGSSLTINVYTIESPKPFTGQCLKDAPGDRILNVYKQFLGTLTVEICLDYCKNFKYAGVTAKNYCFCGNELSQAILLPDSDCEYKCDGDLTQSCGSGLGYTNVYAIETPEKFNGQCLQDNIADRVVDDVYHIFGDSLTVDLCFDFCKDYNYAAVENAKECWCGNKLSQMQLLHDNDCNMKCTGDQTQFCGGGGVLNLYTVPTQRPLRSGFKKIDLTRIKSFRKFQVIHAYADS